jgi:glycosyl hydrolase family 25/putative peptidoglycan binding protein
MATPLALDYASVDENKVPDFAAAKNAGAKIIIPRGAYGRKVPGSAMASSPIYCDPVWNRDKAKIVEAGLKRATYLFLCMPRKGYTTPEPEVQAQAFVDYVFGGGGVGPTWNGIVGPTPAYSGDYPLIMDIEEESSLPAADYFQWCLRAILTIRAQTGAWPIVYSSKRVWTEYLRNRPPGEMANCPLWIAKPWPWATGTWAHLDGAPQWQPDTIDAWGDKTLWLWYQYQGDARGVPGIGQADLSRIHYVRKGDKGDMVSFIQKRLGGIKVDGDFGTATDTEMKKFQAKYGLVQDGVFGVDTAAPLLWRAPQGC